MAGSIAANAEVLDVQLCCWLSRLSMSLQEGVMGHYGTLELVELANFERTACHAALGYIKKNMHSASDRIRFIH